MKLAKRARLALCMVFLFVLGFGALASCTAILGVDTDYSDNPCNSDKVLPRVFCSKGACLQILDFCGDDGLPKACPPDNPLDETCNGIDDNCDGIVDEGCACAEGAKQKCYRGSTSTRKNGLCHDGMQVCENGVWSDCGGDVLPVAELCDQRDNDCNGKVDDTATCICSAGQTQTCYVGPVGTLGHMKAPCKEGKQTCTSDGMWGDCTGSIKPGPTELCDGDIDDNCDGEINEGCDCQPGDTGPCYTGPVMPLDTNGIGVCHGGTWSCVNGTRGPCMNQVIPSPEQCNALDDDCNGKADDGVLFCCTNGTKEGNETDKDCGGSCPSCNAGKSCLQNKDCQSLVCKMDVCQDDACNDFVPNGLETDVDCGGPKCPAKCPIGRTCKIPTDCESGVCSSKVCVAPECIDKVKNGNETDIDCGGSCADCMAGQMCLVNTDCQSAICNGTFFCTNASCGDAVLNGTETDTDCGGDDCNACGNGKKCGVDKDCTSMVCQGNFCAQKPNGAACGATNECLSGNCIDGVCCDTACNGLCEACTATKKGSSPGSDGVCGNIVADKDPDNECTPQLESTCGTTGFCDGLAKCQVYSKTTVCSLPTCANGSTLHKADRCNGNGSCVDAGDQDCSPFACNGGDCITICTLDSQCASGAYCAPPNCLPKQPDGTACTNDKQCSNGHCADGFCCNTACVGGCQACSAALKGFGQNGTCDNILANTDPSDECPDQLAPSCGANGSCDGAGACAKYASSTICVAAMCAGDGITLINASTCNGTGICQPNGTKSCNGYACSGGACLTKCSVDTQCEPTYYCNGVVCSAKKANGNVCSTANECASGSCADGYCCNTACNTDCKACDLTGKLGTCSNVPQGTADPPLCSGAKACDGLGNCSKANGQSCAQGSECGSGFCVDNVCCGSACNGACQACSAANKGGGADGICGNAAITTDPHNDCASQLISSCGTTGACDGNGACAKYAPGSVCVPGMCSGTTVIKDDLCSAGACVDGGTQSCGNYLCAGNACPTSCTVDSQCSSSAYCMLSNCVPKTGLGGLCASDSVCSSGSCADGVCCNSACGGACKSCLASKTGGTTGTCANITTNTDPDSECTAVSCSGGTQTNAQLCSAGACITKGTTPCGLYQCNGTTTCRSTCASDGDCVSTAYCSGTTCTAKQAKGGSCTAANQCSTGNCVDTFCCDTPCNGTCMSCSAALIGGGTNGTCAITKVNTPDPPTCTTPSACNITGACLLTSGQPCTKGSECVSGTCSTMSMCT